VDHISKNKCIVDIATQAFILVAEERFPGAREGLNDLSRGDQDVRLNDD
jgi:hypothetical protein